MIHGHILADSSQPWLLEVHLPVKENICDWDRRSSCWQNRPVQVMCELATRLKDEIRLGLVETKERGPRSDKWSWCGEGCLNLMRIQNWGTDFCCASQEYTLLSRGILHSLFLAPRLEPNHYNPFIGLWCYSFVINHLCEKVPLC